MPDSIKLVYLSLGSSLVLSTILLVYKFVYPKKKINLFLLLILISILPVISIFRSGTYQSADLTLHSVFLQSFFSNLSQGNFIPQWAGDLCGGHGCPIHMFEYPLPYYIGSVFHVLGFNYLNSIKLLLAFSFVLSGIGMYLWLKKEFGVVSAFVGSLFYLFAPYHLEDLHFRASAGETLSFVPIPFIFLFIKEFSVTKKKSHLLLTSLFVAFLMLSHGITFISTLPIILLYAFYLNKNSRKKVKNIAYVFISIAFGFLLTAFYWLPTIFEIKNTWYPPSFVLNDFKPLIEYLYSPALFGFLFQGHNGELRLLIGYFHLLVIVISIILLKKNEINIKYKSLVLFHIGFFFIYFLMMLQLSTPIWNILPLHNSFMFPWRLLLPISFITSVIAAIVVKNIKNKKIIFTLSFLVITSTILNWGNRQMIPEDKNAFYSDVWGYSEYFIPNNQKYLASYNTRVKMEAEIVRSRFSNPLKFLKGKGDIKQFERENTYHKYLINSLGYSTLVEQTSYFPGWQVFVNGRNTKIDFENSTQFGKIVFSIPKGLNEVIVVFGDTKIRSFSKIISIFSWATLLIFSSHIFVRYLLQRSRYFLTSKFHVKPLTHK